MHFGHLQIIIEDCNFIHLKIIVLLCVYGGGMCMGAQRDQKRVSRAPGDIDDRL